MLKREWKKLLSNKLMLVVVIAIIAIPTIYTTLFLGSMWDPYGNVDKLPVAVVNQDKPVSYEGKELQVGKEMTEVLEKDGSLDFHFTDADTARKGLENGTYYMVITIPENFSANAATLTDDNPQKMELLYDTNPGTNYIASKMSATAMETIESSVREAVTKTYTEAVFDQILKAGDGMQEAADGSGALTDGAKELAEGNKTITDNLQTLADSSLTFRDGSKTLTEGLKTYTDGVRAADSGAGQLDEGAGALKDGLSELENQVPVLADGVAALSDGTGALAKGTEAAKQGSEALKSGAVQVDDNLQTLNDGLQTLQAAAASLPQQTQTLHAGAGALADGAESLQTGLSQLETGVNQLIASARGAETQLQGASTGAFEQIGSSAQQMADEVDKILGSLSSITAAEGQGHTENFSGTEGVLEEIAAGRDSAEQSAEAAAAAAESLGVQETADVSYLYDALNQAVEGGDIDAAAAVANEAIAAAEQNAGAASDAGNQLLGASEALNNSSAALSQAGSTMARAAEAAEQLRTAGADSFTAAVPQQLAELKTGLEMLKTGLESLAKGAEEGKTGLNQGIGTAFDGLTQAMSQQLAAGIQKTEAGAEGLAAGAGELKAGTQLFAEASPELAKGIQTAAAGGVQLQAQGTSVLRKGAEDLDTGIGALAAGAVKADDGVKTLEGSVPALTGGVTQLFQGAEQLKDGTQTLKAGTSELTGNNQTLLDGENQLTEGAVQISDGAGKLRDGSKTLGDGIDKVQDGTTTLKSSLADGAKQVKDTNTGENTVDMFAAPVEIRETQITTVENNGHAMAPYMMSVALWVGCIAFSLMYPLTKYEGTLKSGTAWWASKASVLYLIAVLQAVVMIFMLHICDGFEPVEMGKTIGIACLASVAFMSVMYFFTNTLGKVGSFLMLVFMVIQLAGSVGTYPLELSGSFVPYLHDWVPFTYTVEAFRSTISGGESVGHAVVFLLGIFVIFTALTIVEFQIRARKIEAGKHTLDNWLEEKGLA